METEDYREIRLAAVKSAESLSFNTNPNLPLLDNSLTLRERNSIVNRSLCLNAIVATAYGLDKKLALKWLKSEKLESCLSQSESDFLQGFNTSSQLFKLQTESLYVFAWVLGKLDVLDFSCYCPNSLVDEFPDLISYESSKSFRSSIKVRPLTEVILNCDISYNAHASIVYSEINDKPIQSKVEPYVIWERRRALEWLLGDDDWDYVNMDT